jgi:multicomponent K+:H+ antiporter subunit G
MNDFTGLSPVLAGLVGALVMLGALSALIGSIGLLRMKTFYERVHPPTMGTTAGVGLTLAASMLLFSALGSRPLVHEVVIAVFTVITTPVTYVLLVRAAMHRDRVAAAEDDASAPKTPDGGIERR